MLRKETFPGAKRERSGALVGCGHCLGCRADQARDWSIRIQHETMMHEVSWFVTLTYEDGKVPQYGSLYPPDLRSFFKALRRDHPKESISYYVCGEYGGITERPHYHAVLYGAPFLDRYLWREHPTRPVWRSESLERYWPHGLSEFSTVTAASAAYVASYCQKKVHRLDDPEHYMRVDPDTGEIVEIQPEFARMSRRPAIGKRWIRKYWRDVYPKDKVVLDGQEFRPPRFYDKWCEEHQPGIFHLVKQRRRERNEPEGRDATVLRAMERSHETRMKMFSKRGKI